jgi:hypothetical protein
MRILCELCCGDGMFQNDPDITRTECPRCAGTGLEPGTEDES